MVIKQVIFPPGQRGDLRHIAFHQIGQCEVEAVTRLPLLEVDIRILRGAADHRMIRVQRLPTKALQRRPVQQRRQLLIRQHLNLLYFVRGAKAVEEVDKRDPPGDRRQVRHRRQVHHLLNVILYQHGAAGLAYRHHVLVVAKNIQRIGRQRPRADVKNTRQQFTGNFVQIGDHQQQPLRRGVGGGERSRLQRAVDRPGGTGFGLHLHQAHRLAKQILFPLSGPFIDIFRHRRGGGDGVDGRHVGKGVGDPGRRRVAIHCFHVSGHRSILKGERSLYRGSPRQTLSPLQAQPVPARELPPVTHQFNRLREETRRPVRRDCGE